MKSSSGLCYKHVTILNDDSNVIIKWSLKLIDDATRVVIYDRNMFIIQATDVNAMKLFFTEIKTPRN